MNDTTTTRPRIVFNGTTGTNDVNFPEWKVRMQTKLATMRLWNLVSGTELCPATEEEQKAWEEKELKARDFLADHLGPDVLPFLIDHETAPAAWAALLKTYQASSAGARRTHLKELFSMRFDGTVSMDTFILSWRNKVSTL